MHIPGIFLNQISLLNKNYIQKIYINRILIQA